MLWKDKADVGEFEQWLNCYNNLSRRTERNLKSSHNKSIPLSSMKRIVWTYMVRFWFWFDPLRAVYKRSKPKPVEITGGPNRIHAINDEILCNDTQRKSKRRRLRGRICSARPNETWIWIINYFKNKNQHTPGVYAAPRTAYSVGENSHRGGRLIEIAPFVGLSGYLFAQLPAPVGFACDLFSPL